MEVNNSNIKSALVGFVFGMFSFAGGEALYEKYSGTTQQPTVSGFIDNKTSYEGL